jgi:hypothetical protein
MTLSAGRSAQRHVSNPGNTAALWHVLIVVGNSVYYFKTSASAGCIGVMTSGEIESRS